MGCGCAKKVARSRQKKAKAAKKNGSIIRKRRVNRLIAIPGTSSRRKNATNESAEATEET
jgi:hypothetical protein